MLNIIERNRENMKRVDFLFTEETAAHVWNTNNSREKVSSWFEEFFNYEHLPNQYVYKNLARFLTASFEARASNMIPAGHLSWLCGKVYYLLPTLAEESGVFFEHMRDEDDESYSALQAWREKYSLDRDYHRLN